MHETLLTESAPRRPSGHGAMNPPDIRKLTEAVKRGDETAFTCFHEVGFGTGAIALAAVLWGTQRAPRPVFPGKGAAFSPVPFTMIVRNFTEDQLLAMFPKGSCIFAEVDGQTRFFILDEKLAAEGLQMQ